MSLRRISENKALVLIPTADGGGKLVEAKPQEVVEEETFVDSVSSILDRDFFPELPKLRAYNEYLDAVQARDYAKMAEVRSKWRQVAARTKRSRSIDDTPGINQLSVLGEPLETPKRAKHFETFDDTEHQSEDSQLTKDAREMTLDAFLSKYTSEDDASFSRLVEKEVTAARKAYQHAYEHANRVQSQMANSGRLVGWKNHDPSHASVMSFPAGIPRTFTPEEMKSSDKAVVPENTRFPEGGPSWNRANSSSNSSSAASSSSAPTFREPLPITSTTGNLDAQLYQALLEERRGNAIFENVNTESSVSGYAFVATPQVNPGNVDQSPLITWGEVHEPVALDEIDSLTKVGAAVAPASSGTGFTVPAISKTSIATASLVKKTIPKRTPKITANSPLVRSGLTPDLQLRSSYSPVIRSHGKRSVTATPSRPGSQANTPALR